MLALAGLMFSLMTAAARDVNFSKTCLSIRQAFGEIEQQTPYRFMYGSKSLNVERQVCFSSNPLSLEQALHEMLDGLGFTYSQRNQYIIVKAIPEQKQQKNEALASNTGDRYQPSNTVRMNPSVVRKRTMAAPKIYIEEPSEVEADTLRTENPPVFTSHITSIESYVTNQYKSHFALRTNLLYWASATPNLSAEIGLGDRTSLKVSGSYNPWSRKGSLEKNKKLVHWTMGTEFRYWTCERFNGHFFGAHALYSDYNISTQKIPLLDFKKEYRYDGTAYGIGFSYGYHWMLSKRWGLEFNAGVGYMRLDYDRFDCISCNREGEKFTKNYFGPTQAGISLVFMIK